MKHKTRTEPGPKLIVRKDKDWLAFLEKEYVDAWYHNHRIYSWLRQRKLGILVKLANKFAPRGFARPDNVDGATPGDVIYVTQSAYDSARVAVAEWRKTGRIGFWLWFRMNVVPHERKHCMVDWTPTPEQLERWSHPDTAMPALAHAARVGGATNAFTGALRLKAGWKDQDWPAFVTWFESQVAYREIA